ncbi:MAG: MopE-related protein [Patescibacteria group bacterium]
MHSKKSGLITVATIFVTVLLSATADAYQTIAHRYITCKALEGLRDPLPEAHTEFRQYAHCDDCTIFKGDYCIGLSLLPPAPSQSLIHAIRTPEWQEVEFCGGLNGPTYQPPGHITIAELEVLYDGDDLVTGSSVEDALNAVDPRSNLFTPAFASHFWDPDIYHSSFVGDFDGGLAVAVRPITRFLFCDSGISNKCRVRQSSYHRAQALWATAVSLYREGKTRESYYALGRVAHLLEDLTSPAHVHGDNHNGDKRSRPFLHTCCGGGRHPDSRPDTLETYTASKEVLQRMNRKKIRPYKDEQLLSDDIWDSLDADQKGRLFKLFWFTAQKTQYWASNGDQNPNGPLPGDQQCSEDIPDTSTICDEYAFGTLGEPNIYFDKDGNTGFLPLDLWSASNSPLTLPCRINTSLPGEQKRMAKALLGHSLSAVSGLYRLFWDQTHDQDGDGYGVVTDCDDANQSRFPGNAEICTDQFDNNCDGTVNENCPSFTITHNPWNGDGHPHNLADIQVIRSGLLSSLTRLTINPVGGFNEDVELRLVGVAPDEEPTGLPDGLDDDSLPDIGDGIPDSAYSLTSPPCLPQCIGARFGVGAGIPIDTVSASNYSIDFRVKTLPALPVGRYMVKVEGTAATPDGPVTGFTELVLVVGDSTSVPSFTITHNPRPDSHPHHLADMTMGSSQLSSEVIIGVQGVDGFDGMVTLTVVGMSLDYEPVRVPDGPDSNSLPDDQGDGIPDDSTYSTAVAQKLTPVLDGVNRYSINVLAGSSVAFKIRRVNLPPNRYMIKIVGTATVGSDIITNSSEILVAVGEGTSGYIEQ